MSHAANPAVMTNAAPTTNLLLWGYTSGDMAAVARNLHDSRPGTVWVGKDRACDYRLTDFYEYDIDRFTHLLAHAGPTPAALTEDERHVAYAVMQRVFPGWQLNHWDMQQLLALFLRIFDGLLAKHRIGSVWFAYVPHQGPETLLYHAAKARGLKVRMFYQSLFPNRVTIADSIPDFGKACDFAGGWPDFDEDFGFGKPERDWFYMRTLPPPPAQLPWLLDSYVDRIKKRLRGKSRALDIMALAKRIHERATWLAWIKFTPWDDPDAFKGKEYVYFPLHMQPELTTDPLGGRYGDQALALETLRRQLPAEVAIVVKENPKQDFEWRDPCFFTRIRSLPNTFVVAPTVNTYFLLRHAKAVATITGTAGWEALLAGMPAITYGAAWYRDLPGVFPAEEGLDWPTVRHFQADFVRLREGLARMAEYTPEAIASGEYNGIFPAYDPAKNRQRLLHLIEQYD